MIDTYFYCFFLCNALMENGKKKLVIGWMEHKLLKKKNHEGQCILFEWCCYTSSGLVSVKFDLKSHILLAATIFTFMPSKKKIQ